MTHDWRSKLKRLIDETPGLSMKAVSLKAEMHPSAVHDMIKRGQAPSIDKFLSICAALNVSPAVLLSGDDAASISIPVVGFVSAGEGWTPIDDTSAPDDAIEFDLGSHDTIGLEVRGDSMAPVYRNGDYLICHRQFGPNADNCIGLDCVIRTAAGQNFVKILRRGSRGGRFTLRSYNPVIDDIEDVALAWAAPVAWIRRGGR